MGQHEAQLQTEAPIDKWNNYIQRAVKKFLKTAVIIDNQPSLAPSTFLAKECLDFDSGMDGFSYNIDSENTPDIDTETHDLDIRRISDLFTESGISCAFVLPNDSDTDSQRKQTRALRAAKASDLIIIDWYLEPKSPSLTLRILKEIASSDTKEHGRLRLICVYTGEPLKEEIFRDIKNSLESGGIETEDVSGKEYCAIGVNTVVVLKNKTNTTADQLPTEMVEAFSMLANGIVPAFALASIGSIRDSTHHMLTRFSSNLDSAFVANRLITNPPSDVSDLMEDLLSSEIKNSLGLDQVSEKHLSEDSIMLWLDMKNSELSTETYNARSKHITLDRDKINGLLKNGLVNSQFISQSGEKIELPEKHRGKVSVALSGSLEKSQKSEREFSRIVALKREAHGYSTRLTNVDWLPHLTTGTILKHEFNNEVRYLMCFTPACDTLRITKSIPFVFIEGVRNDKKHNLVITEACGSNTGILFDKKNPTVRTYNFSPDSESQRVRAINLNNSDSPLFYFESSDNANDTFEWLGEIRYDRATSDVATLANTWLRIGISDSEYLRLAAKGDFKFGR